MPSPSTACRKRPGAFSDRKAAWRTGLDSMRKSHPVRHHRSCIRQDHAEHLHPYHQRNERKRRSQHYATPRRRPGTGYIKQINDHLWEGRYSPVWPDGKKHSRNVYGRTREEAEAKLADLILQMKAEIAALRSGKAAEYPDGVSPKKKQIAAYLRENPGVSNKSYIARQLGMDVTTVRKYYDEVRTEMAALATQ